MTPTFTDRFRVIVPYIRMRKTKYVSYPGSGQPLYTREQATVVLQKFHDKDPDPELTPYAESDHERFDLIS